ncbi:CYTH domain-containing protein [Candidatus Woesearchaeota archaeon]|nr:CYTH domain-containing protein [Candidatus Woesearchaeota archaeon]
MKEIEVKILETNRKDVIGRLESLSATLIYDGPVLTTWYDSGPRALRKNRTLRIRSTTDGSELTLKKQSATHQEVKERKEIKCIIGAASDLHDILAEMEYRPDRTPLPLRTRCHKH